VQQDVAIRRCGSTLIVARPVVLLSFFLSFFLGAMGGGKPGEEAFLSVIS